MTPEELRLRTKQFGTDVVRLCESLPRDSRTQEIASQLVDAATGVGSNYRSTCRARSRADFINKLSIALDCSDEAFYWLEVLIESSITSAPEAKRLKEEAEELTKILSASRTTARRNDKSAANRSRDHR